MRDAAADGDPLAFAIGAEVLGAARRSKTESKRSLKWPVDRIAVVDHDARVRALQSVIDDVREASNAAALEVEVGAEASISVDLAAEPEVAADA